MHAKSTGELISVGFSDRSVEVWSQRITESRRKNDFTFWLIFGLSSNLGVSESLCKKLIQKVKSPKCCEVSSACELSRQNFVSRYYRNESNREIRHVRYLPRQQWSLLNCFRTEQGHCGACSRKWRLTDTDLCPCGETQTMSHIVESCPLTKLNGGLSRLHSADEDAVLWLTSYGS